MKRFPNVLLTIFLMLCLLPTSVFAAERTYKLDELGMSIAIPEDYVTFTRDIKDNDPNLSTSGWTKDELSAFFIERSIYLNAWDKNINYEIIVTMVDSELEDFNLISDTSLAAFTSAMATEYENMGITYIKSDTYQHNQAKFMKIYISQPLDGNSVYGLEYSTVYDGKTINITLQSYSGNIDSKKEAILKEIVDSVHFDTDPQRIEPPTPTPAFIYTDPNSSLSFTVPKNWVKAPMNEERQYIDVKFTSNLEEGLCIIFTNEDIYGSEEFTSELTAEEKRVLTRKWVDANFPCTDVLTETYHCNEDDISMVTYGGKEYYYADVTATTDIYGMTISMPMVCLLRCENGYLYMFQFNSSSDSPYFDDFTKLVSSVQYPEFEDTSLVQDQISGSYIVIAAAVVIVLCSLPVILYRRTRQKKSTQEVNMQTNPQEPDAESRNTPIIFCHQCGSKLISGSCFCSQCGTKIPVPEEKH